MKIALLFLLLTFGLNLNAAVQSKTEDSWLGDYDYAESDMNAGGTRSYVVSRSLEIRRENGKLRAYYYVTENGDPRGNREIFDAQIVGNTLSLFYQGCDFANREDATEQQTECESSEFKKGDLMFKLVKSGAAKKQKILTFWGKLKLHNNTGMVFFEKSSG